MKRIFFLFFVLSSLIAQAGVGAIILNPKGQGDDRSGSPLYPDMPLAYYCYDDKTQWILIDGGGAVSYYDVEISIPVINTVEFTTQVDGTYDTFDISSLAPSLHVITIESPSGNIYEGTF
jgi:hypothetical protein